MHVKLISFVIAACALLSPLAWAAAPVPVTASAGEIFLPQHKLQGQALAISGPWEYYAKRLLEPGELNDVKAESGPSYLEVPFYWDRPDSLQNFATFRLTIRSDHSLAGFGIRSPLMSSSSKIWMNGRLVQQSGEISTQFSANVPSMRRQIIALPDAPTAEIVIQLANAFMPGFGISEPMMLNEMGALQLAQLSEGLGDQILLGAVLTLIAYNFFGWAFGRDRTMRFWLLILSTTILVKLSLYHPRVTWLSLGFTNDSRSVLLLSVLAYYGMILASYQSINCIFGKPFARQHTGLIYLFFAVLSVRLFLLTPAEYYSDLYFAHAAAIMLMVWFIWRIRQKIAAGASYPKVMIISLVAILPFAALAIVFHASGNFQARIVENLVFVALIFILSIWKAKQLAHSNQKLMVEIKKRQHAYKQMVKMVFPHQLRLIQEKCAIEKTMPIGSCESAVVICFDLIDSTKIDHPECKNIVTELFRLCHELMMKNYDSEVLSANAYRINEVGDGFYCSLGFPFKIPAGRHAEELALELAEGFVLAADLVSRQYGLEHSPLRCSIGIARGSIHGSFTQHGIQRYELFGDAIVLATRYESMRRILFHAHAWNGHILILQKTVVAGLARETQSTLVEMPLLDSLRVRNDDAADALYYRLIHLKERSLQLAS